MNQAELSECLQFFYASVRQKNGEWEPFKVTSLRAIRAAIDRHLKQNNKLFSIIGDVVFEKANKTLDAVCKNNMKEGKVRPTVHKERITKEQMKQLFLCGQLGDADTQDPAQLLRTAWFYVTLYFGKRGRENQRKLTPEMLVLQKTPQGRRYFELAIKLATKNHQGGLNDPDDKSDGKMFEFPDSSRCPVKTLENYIQHLSPNNPCLFQRPKDPNSAKFDPQQEKVWHCNAPIGEATLNTMMKSMSKSAGITPHLTNHCVRATAVSVLSDENVEARHIKAVTGHKSDVSIESYSSRASFEQKESMSAVLSRFIAGDSSENLAVAGPSVVAQPLHVRASNEQPSSLDPVTAGSSPSLSVVNNQQWNGSPASFNFHGCSVTIVNNNYSR